MIAVIFRHCFHDRQTAAIKYGSKNRQVTEFYRPVELREDFVCQTRTRADDRIEALSTRCG